MRQHRLAADADGVRLPGVEETGRLVQLSVTEEKLDVLGRPPAKAGLTPPEPYRLTVGSREADGARGRVAAPEVDKPENRDVLWRMQTELLLGQLERTLGVAACEVELTTVDGHDGTREMVLRNLQAVLDRDVVCVGSVLGRELETTRPELDPREAPQRTGTPRLVAVTPIAVLALEQRTGLGGRERVDDRLRRLLDEPLATERAPRCSRRPS